MNILGFRAFPYYELREDQMRMPGFTAGVVNGRRPPTSGYRQAQRDDEPSSELVRPALCSQNYKSKCINGRMTVCVAGADPFTVACDPRTGLPVGRHGGTPPPPPPSSCPAGYTPSVAGTVCCPVGYPYAVSCFGGAIRTCSTVDTSWIPGCTAI